MKYGFDSTNLWPIRIIVGASVGYIANMILTMSSVRASIDISSSLGEWESPLDND